MRSTQHRTRVYGTVAALALSAGSLGMSAAVAAEASPTPIAPHQSFVGQVNGATVKATIKVGCFGPTVPGQTGHPLAGQTVAVAPGFTTQTGSTIGQTGESADHIAVGFGNAASAEPPTVLKAYRVAAEIPTTIYLPCYGTGKVVFVPLPTSDTARTAAVEVTYVSGPGV